MTKEELIKYVQQFVRKRMNQKICCDQFDDFDIIEIDQISISISCYDKAIKDKNGMRIEFRVFL